MSFNAFLYMYHEFTILNGKHFSRTTLKRRLTIPVFFYVCPGDGILPSNAAYSSSAFTIWANSLGPDGSVGRPFTTASQINQFFPAIFFHSNDSTI